MVTNVLACGLAGKNRCSRITPAVCRVSPLRARKSPGSGAGADRLPGNLLRPSSRDRCRDDCEKKGSCVQANASKMLTAARKSLGVGTFLRMRSARRGCSRVCVGALRAARRGVTVAARCVAAALRAARRHADVAVVCRDPSAHAFAGVPWGGACARSQRALVPRLLSAAAACRRCVGCRLRFSIPDALLENSNLCAEV